MTDLGNRAAAEQIITLLYARIGKAAPRFFWFDNPLLGILACHVVPLLRSPTDSDLCGSWLEAVAPVPFRRPVSGQIPPNLWLDLDAHLGRTFGGKAARLQVSRSWEPWIREFMNRFWTAFWGQLESHLEGDIWIRYREAFHSRTRHLSEPTASALRLRPVSGFWGGTVEGGLPRQRRHGSGALRVDALQRACGWWCPFDGFAICADRPRRIHVDASDRLHRASGPSVEFSSCDRVYAWHGTVVPAEWIERREALTPSIALRWRHPGQRRAAAEIVGWAKLLELLPNRVIDADPDPQIGTLLECDLPGAALSRFLRVRCGTGRQFALSVPREMTTARQANAWTYGLRSEQYELEARS